MYESIGLASGSPARKPPLTKVQTGGRFAAELGPSHLGCALETVPQDVEIALLTKGPAQEGLPYSEFECEGYTRQKVRLVPGGGSGRFANLSEFTFELPVSSWSPATHIAIMDRDNRVLFYGVLRQWGHDKTRPNEIRFDAHEFVVRRP